MASTNTSTAASTAHAPLPIKDAAIAGVINAVINGYISWSGFKAEPAIALTVDSISSGAHSAIGSAVMVATALGLILTLVNFAINHKHLGGGRPAGRGLYRAAFRAAFGNALSLFGLCVVIGVLWQRVFGSIMVSPLVATLVVATVAGLVSAWMAIAARAAYLDAQRRG